MPPTSSDIRQQFIDFFTESRGHRFVPSSPVVPHDDPTLLFANAGMNQFKPYFLGTEAPPSPPRAANTQKCIRAGGKHNDLDDVGKDTYHHTFFEMLGNWSFGDYFKAEAIDWAWDLLVNVWGLDPDRLHATYFEGDAAQGLEPDEEARQLWSRHLPPERIHPGNAKDNFWEMGDTGPCGPCSEIHYDGTPGRDGASHVNADHPDVIEVWNLVFIQFNRGSSGGLTPLPAKHVDTGMGFERIVRVLQGKDSNYDTDVFTPLFEAIQQVTGARGYQPGGAGDRLTDPINVAYRVIADHIRCLTFALADGAHCGNTGRSSVLRTILRRAVRYGHQQLGVEEPFFYKLVPAVVEQMGGFFPELKKNPDAVAAELKEEEESFRETLARGIAIFMEAAQRAEEVVTIIAAAVPDGQPAPIYAGREPVLKGQEAFDLEATYGFPISLTQVMAEERGLTVDMAGYEQAKARHAEVSRGDGGGADVTGRLVEIVQQHKPPATEFVGYDTTSLTRDMTVRAFDVGDGQVAILAEATPFYGEAGGQVGDVGTVAIADGPTFNVTDTQKVGDAVFHLAKGDPGEWAGEATLAVDADRRAAVMANHTATHLMNRALRDLVNADTQQKGSLVAPDRLRFDFSQPKALTNEQLDAVEAAVSADIAADHDVYTAVVPQEQALQINGLRAVFGEKYPPRVRVVSIGAPVEDLLADPGSERWATMSIEFCGGTHLPSTGKAFGFTIISEEPVSKGVRRLTALTGDAANRAEADAEQVIDRLEALRDATPENDWDRQAEAAFQAVDAVTMPLTRKREAQALVAELTKRLKELRKQEGAAAEGQVVEAAKRIAEEQSGPVIVAHVPEADAKTIRTAMDVISKKHPDAALLLAGTGGDKVALIAKVPKPMIDAGLKAGDWVKRAAQAVGGGGGGRPDMAQAGGKDPAKVPAALDAARDFAAAKTG